MIKANVLFEEFSHSAKIETNCMSVAIINVGTVSARLNTLTLAPGASIEFGMPQAEVQIITELKLSFQGIGTRLVQVIRIKAA